ncbi:MAG: hypothetical protein ACRDSR_21475 [Pseudonocardiaceae bacterium]
MTVRVAQRELSIAACPEAGAEELAELAARAGDRATAGQALPGTRAGEIFVAGALTVMLALSEKLRTALTETAQSWVCLSGGRNVKLELDDDVLEVTGITQRDQRELIHAWIDRHTDR